ncbi:MAG: hypothetical protein JWO05_71 [Gemmatimonadetes bacterium]|nr:hypothetical protein [Gemmatimonadota bacterium]
MSRFQFSLNNNEHVRQAGVVQSATFDEALELLRARVSAKPGDVLELGVPGFPPAQFDCVASLLDGKAAWSPRGRSLAA